MLFRSLQSIVKNKKIVTTIKGARQLIVHKKIRVGANIIDSPSYIVSVDLEDKISLKSPIKTSKEKIQEIPVKK